MKIKNLIRTMGCVFVVTMLFALTACGQQSQVPDSSDETKKSNVSQTEVAEPTTDGEGDKILVAYFSATGNTKAAAGYIAKTLGADLYEIVPETPYTSDDLNWTDSSSRVNAEHEDLDFRPAIAGETKDLSEYDTIFLGYPIWWGEAPNIIATFMENSNFAGKTIIPFCTSSTSSLGSSAETLHAYAPKATWLEGQRFSGNVAESEVAEWVKGLEIVGGE